MRIIGIALCAAIGVGCLPEEQGVQPDAAPADADPNQPDAIPPADAPPLTEGVALLTGGPEPGTADGPRDRARFNNPVNVAVGPGGDLFVTDFDNDLVRQVTPGGEVSTLVDQAMFQRPFGLVVDGEGTLYVQTDDNDSGAHSVDTGTVWRVDLDSGEATVVARDLGRPRGLAALSDGRLVLSDMMHHMISLLDPDTGDVTVLAGVRDMLGHANGTGDAARFNRPYGVVVTPSDEILVADFDNHCIREITLAGAVTDFAGTCSAAGDMDGDAATARFNRPQALALDSLGNLYVSDTYNYTIRVIDTSGQVSTLAGDGNAGYRDGALAEAQFYGLEGHAISGDGSYLYVADGNRGDGGPYHRIRRVSLP